MDIKLFDASEMKTGRGGGKRGTGEKYAKYKTAIAPHVEFLKNAIEDSADGTIRVAVTDLAKSMGMTGRHETSIYWGLKYVLFHEGIVVTTGQTKDGSPVLIMRNKVEGDVLPESLTRSPGEKKSAAAEKAGAGAAGSAGSEE